MNQIISGIIILQSKLQFSTCTAPGSIFNTCTTFFCDCTVLHGVSLYTNMEGHIYLQLTCNLGTSSLVQGV